MPIFHDCQRCTACCRWPGQVRVSPAEITRIAAFLEQDETDFIQQHTRLQADRRGLALQEQPDGACVFLKDQLCAIQPVKPQQCRDFPNLWQYPGAEKFCRAIPREVSEDEYVRLVAAATQRSADKVREILKRQADREC
jgi:Fe-S-cluster containining protein